MSAIDPAVRSDGCADTETVVRAWIGGGEWSEVRLVGTFAGEGKLMGAEEIGLEFVGGGGGGGSQLIIPTTSPRPPLPPGTVARGGLLEPTTSSSTIPRPALLQRELLLSRWLLLSAVLGDSREPVDEDGHGGVEEDVSLEDTEVAPAVRVLGAEELEEVVGLADAAILAVGRGAPVDQVAAGARDEGVHELCAGLAGGWGEVQDLAGLAVDIDVCDADCQHAVDEVAEGREMVHEDPEAGHHGGAGEDTAEDEAEGEEEVGDVAAGLGGLHTGDNHGAEGRGEHEEGPDEEEHEGAALVELACGLGVAVHADGVVVGGEKDDGHETVPWELDDDVGHDEDLP
ncbi:hypothetical protein V502_10511 [Pseudogymnoascus sp. VKM F-4520 (FW-2644)]|nr:hypothetical protein V502_10511 [Pseudogymnoascus sp. VKM F-4520 (FW-2644)]